MFMKECFSKNVSGKWHGAEKESSMLAKLLVFVSLIKKIHMLFEIQFFSNRRFLFETSELKVLVNNTACELLQIN